MTGPTVVGSGATALACALFAARHGPVALHTRPRTPRPAVESVPAATLTLLLELGITPDELRVEHLHRTRLTAWEHPAPTTVDGPARAHVDTVRLVTALRRLVTAHPAITLREDRRPPVPGWIDATGRRALSAAGQLRPPQPWTATLVTVPAHPRDDDTLRMAAGPDGYVYRLGTPAHITVGWVGPGPPPRTPAAIRDRITRAGAPWVLEGVDLGDDPLVTHRPASASIPLPGRDAVPIGDAALSRDALAAQGLSVGLSDACLTADPTADPAAMARRRAEAAPRHLAQLRTALGHCRHRRRPCWTNYLDWLDQTDGSDTRRRTGPAHAAPPAPSTHP